MARRRSSSPRKPASPANARPTPPSPAASDVPPWLQPLLTPRGFVFGAFVLMSLAVLATSFSGYLFDRNVEAMDRALAEGRYDDAIEPLLAVLEQFEGAWIRRTQLGHCYLETGRGAEALEAYQRSLRDQPDQKLMARMGRARFLANPEDAQATEHFTAAVLEAREAAETYYYIGLTHMDEGNLIEAARFLQRATGDPKYFEKVKPLLAEIATKLLGS